MPDDAPLRPASPDDLASALMFALRFDGRKRVRTGDEMMARITAERLIEHLPRERLCRHAPTAARGTGAAGGILSEVSPGLTIAPAEL